jgi:hypothetical protein
VVFWLGFWFWWEHPGAELGRFFDSLAVVGTWGDQPPSGVVGGGPRVTRRCPRRCGAGLCPWPGGGGRFFSGGSLRDKWLGRTPAYRHARSDGCSRRRCSGTHRHEAHDKQGEAGRYQYVVHCIRIAGTDNYVTTNREGGQTLCYTHVQIGPVLVHTKAMSTKHEWSTGKMRKAAIKFNGRTAVVWSTEVRKL